MAVNKFDNSMFDAGTIGTTANKLLQLDGSTKIPAVDGSLLTGIVGFTKSASDPTISTNPSGGVGSLWANTTSGEVYCCTDATAGANVWTNVGAGTGDIVPLQSNVYGYCAGGRSPTATINNIQRFAFASDGNATDTGDLFGPSRMGGGCSSTSHGYIWNGLDQSPPGNALQNIFKFSFVTGSDGALVGSLAAAVPSYGSAACQSTTHGYGSGGYRQQDSPPAMEADEIEKWSFATDSNATDVGNLIAGSYVGASGQSSTYGYHAGGGNQYGPGPNGAPYGDDINKWPFASDTNATDVGNLIDNRVYISATESTVNLYIAGGSTSATNVNNHIQKRSFSSDGNSSDIANLTVARKGLGACASATYGYCIGGTTNSTAQATDIIEKWTFASDSDATDVGNLALTTNTPTGHEY